MPERSSIFDMIGPVMIGPSSSHTAGVVKIARVTHKILGSVPETASITFYNSFARTYEGHGSDKAVIGGLLGYKPDDGRIRKAFDFAEEANFSYSFRSVGNASTYHPNTVRIKATRGDKTIEVYGESRGGGVIKIVEINGFHTAFGANLDTLMILAEDIHGGVAFFTHVLAQEDCNIAHMTVARKVKKDQALWVVEMDTPVREETFHYLKSIHYVKEVVYMKKME